MTFEEVMTSLKNAGTEQTQKTWRNHGAQGEVWGVKIGDMKVIQKKIKHNHELALQLFDTGIPDAMYFGGLISEPKKMSKAQLNNWAKKANWYMLSEYTVSWAAAESNFGHELALAWIDSAEEHIAAAGWSTYAGLLALKNDQDLDLKEIEELLKRIERNIAQEKNRVRYMMNNFVISVGAYVAPLTQRAKEVAAAIGKVNVNLGGTACKVPDAKTYIEKIESMNRIGLKRKTVFC